MHLDHYDCTAHGIITAPPLQILRLGVMVKNMKRQAQQKPVDVHLDGDINLDDG